MGSDAAEEHDISAQDQITRLDLEVCSEKDLSISSVNLGDHRAVEDVVSKKSRFQMHEVLREQLSRAQETLAANHDQALFLLLRCLAQPGLQANIDGERNVPGGSRTAAHGGASAAMSSCSIEDKSLRAGGSPNLLGIERSGGSPSGQIAILPDGKGDSSPPIDDIDEIVAIQAPPFVCSLKNPPPPPYPMGMEPVASLHDLPPMLLPVQTHVEDLHAEVQRENIASAGGLNMAQQASCASEETLDNLPSAMESTCVQKGSLISHGTALDRPTLISDEIARRCKFEVLPSWKEDPQKLAAKVRLKQAVAQRQGHNRFSVDWHVLSTNAHEPTTGGHDKKQQHLCFLHPQSTKRFVWDLCSLFLVTYDMAVIPLSFFEPPDTFFLTFCAWVTRVFWTADIVASFITGFLKHDGSTETRFAKIARHYILSWFLLDIFIVGIDWVEVGSAATSTDASFLKSSRVIRIIRLVRLLRLVRMQEVLHHLQEGINSESILVVLDITKMIVLMMAMAHLLACIWWSIGSMDYPTTWVSEYRYERLSLGYRYTTSLHWSLSQLTGGMDEVTPCNTTERVFVILVFLMMFIEAAIFVSHITSSMTRLHMITSQQSLQLSLLRKYFQQNKISKRLATRVFRYAKHRQEVRQRFKQEEEAVLDLVSETLREELHFEIFAPVLEIHGFFNDYIAECPQVMRKICHSATVMSAVSPGDNVFTTGEMPADPMMYFIVSGELRYTTLHGEAIRLYPDEWVSEGTLWTSWVHRGNLEAYSESQLCTIDAKGFEKIACQFEHAGFDPRCRAAEFVALLNKLDDDDEITDLDPRTGGRLRNHKPSVFVMLDSLLSHRPRSHLRTTHSD